jgi:hypothetical protein
MTHPVEQLVDLVDGTLPQTERAAVSAHLQTCDRCRREVALARSARAALTGMPDVRAPAGIGAAAIRAAEGAAADAGTGGGSEDVVPLAPRRVGSQRAGTPGWYRWAVGGGIAAALLVVVLALPNVGSDDAAPGAEDAVATGAPGQRFSAAKQVDREGRDYDVAEIQALADGVRARAAQDRAAPPPGMDFGPTTQVPAAEGGASLSDSVACLQAAAPATADEGPPIRVIRATFDGQPAVIGVFVTGPGADQAADTVTVWVVSGDCGRILHTTQTRI